MNIDKDFESAGQVLVINLLYLGDLIFSLPLLKELKSQCPRKEYHLLALEPFASLLAAADFVDELIACDKKAGISEAVRVVRSLRKEGYDFSLNIHGSWRSLLLQQAISAKTKAGYARESFTFQSLFLDYARDWCPEEEHIVDYQLRWLNELGLEVPENPQLPGVEPPKSAGINIDHMLNDNFSSDWRNELLILNPGGSWPGKRWPVEKFIELGRQVLTRLDAKIVITGGESDRERNSRIEQGIARRVEENLRDSIFQAAGRTSIPELLALMSRARVVISGDTGPAHVAALAGTPQLTIFGPSDERKYHPFASENKSRILKRDIDCRPCGEHECPREHHRCLKEIQPGEVFEEIKVLWA
ncbi:glycosyltransferase family 9 protein [Halarsenatibacter silvermanii]|uniref:Heptosyltransferase-3 n=1 Tax=Halarsenatibacter silvermanii TaxID=321763 RepID=A0A1G9I138_9FIRM|nr:glycosyltransferase family 9 protein [Halarsenatibacter silvermanii]SDL18543.1 heptosyltransferase-3 [Halarsenatibacter silvermanii]